MSILPGTVVLSDSCKDSPGKKCCWIQHVQSLVFKVHISPCLGLAIVYSSRFNCTAAAAELQAHYSSEAVDGNASSHASSRAVRGRSGGGGGEGRGVAKTKGHRKKRAAPSKGGLSPSKISVRKIPQDDQREWPLTLCILWS